VTIDRPARIGILTVSDRAARGEYEDRGGPAIRSFLEDRLESPWKAEARVVPDDRAVIESTLIELCDAVQCDLVLTTGGTGPAPRDVTPEATEAVCERLMPGFGEHMRRVSQDIVPTAVLSCQTAGLRGKTLLLNLPGKPAAIDDCLGAVIEAIPYCLDLIGAGRIDLKGGTFRPGERKKS